MSPKPQQLPMGDDVNPFLIRNGQQWKSQKRACYKCTDYQSNMPMTGRCPRYPGRTIVSGDECKGDTCGHFALRPDATLTPNNKPKEIDT